MIEPLTFDLVDDICLGIEGGALTLAQLPPLSVQSVGPFFELIHTLGDGKYGEVSPGVFKNLVASQSQNHSHWFHADNGQGFSQVRRLCDDQLMWNDFSIRASHAARESGFTKDEAWKLTAAIGEIYGNIVEHSESIGSGYVAYAANGKSFEFVVADSGVGVLNSLRKNPLYAQISDSGTALECALSEGVSRFQEPGRGLGFRSILVGLANISSRVRFRSGDYGRELQRSADGSIPATTRQLARLNGMFCSVLCESTTSGA